MLSESSIATLKQLVESLSMLTRQLEEMFEPFGEFEESHKEVQDKMLLIAEGLEHFSDSVETFKVACTMLGYPPHNDISPAEINQIAATYKDFNNEIEPMIHQFYIEKFDSKFLKEEFLSRWKESDLLKKRIHIIEESITCFDQGLYYAAMPLLFSQLEGVVADAHNHEGKMLGPELKKYILDMFISDNKFSYDEQLNYYYTKIIIQGFGHNQPLKSFLSRHAIMHGGDVEYGTRINYIKLILFLDSVYIKLITR